METLISVRSDFCHESENGVCHLVIEYLTVGIIGFTPFFGVRDVLRENGVLRIKWVELSVCQSQEDKTLAYNNIRNGRLWKIS